MLVERLARRLGYDAVAAQMPEEHRRLLTHIHKEKTRKLRDDKAEKVTNPVASSCPGALSPGPWCPCIQVVEIACRHD